MTEFSSSDITHMASALKLAARGRYGAPPNPTVGCVLVRDGAVIGKGWHARCGEAHAEINALSDAGDARGATAYVTLEPCSHHGKTPPCSDALIAAGIKDVVCAMQDPFPAVSGNGIAALRRSGIDVRVGLLQPEAERLIRGYLKRVREGRPFVRIKIASSLDGAIAMKSGESQWITGPQARNDVQRLRAESGAILSGIGTVLADDPSFTVRHASIETYGRQPLRAIVDSTLRLPLSSRMLCLAGDTIIYCCVDTNRESLEAAGAELVKVDGDNNKVSLEAVLSDLARRDVNDVLVEAGPVLTGSMLAAGLVDELVIYQAPHIMGSETVSMFETPGFTKLADKRQLNISDIRRVGADMRITASLADN